MNNHCELSEAYGTISDWLNAMKNDWNLTPCNTEIATKFVMVDWITNMIVWKIQNRGKKEPFASFSYNSKARLIYLLPHYDIDFWIPQFCDTSPVIFNSHQIKRWVFFVLFVGTPGRFLVPQLDLFKLMSAWSLSLAELLMTGLLTSHIPDATWCPVIKYESTTGIHLTFTVKGNMKG